MMVLKQHIDYVFSTIPGCLTTAENKDDITDPAKRDFYVSSSRSNALRSPFLVFLRQKLPYLDDRVECQFICLAGKFSICIHKLYGWNEYWVLSNLTLVLLLSGFSCAVMLNTAHLTYMCKFIFFLSFFSS